jgi:hypothetical protein
MPGNPQNPDVGDLHIDASILAPCIVDLPPGEMQGLRVEKEGLAEVIAEINANQATTGDKAGITQGNYSDSAAAVGAVRTGHRGEAAVKRIKFFVLPSRAHTRYPRQSVYTIARVW